jgi:dipeptidyl aminopeptidase/acylaminoacyl peptidase
MNRELSPPLNRQIGPLKWRLLKNGLAIALLSVALGFAPIFAVQADELRPVTHEEVWLMNRVGSPVVSPDGRFAVVSVTEPAYEEDDSVADLWLITLDGSSAPRRLTATAGGESGPAWSPDGTRLAFSAKRGTGEEEKAQIHVLAMDGPGESVRITDLSTGASNPKWSPDGSMIAFESRVFRDAEDDASNQAQQAARDELGINVSRYEIFPIRQWDRWRDELQTRLFVQEADAGAQPRDLMVGSELVSGAGYAGVPSLGGDSLHAAWTPSGDALIISATENLDDAAHAAVHYHLYRVPLDDGKIRPMTDGDSYSCTAARFSPGGEHLFCSYRPSNEFVYNHTEIARGEWRGKRLGQLELLSTDFDRSVSGFSISEDGETLYLNAHDQGRTRLFALDVASREVRALDADSAGVYATPEIAGASLVTTWQSSATPVEVVRVDPASGEHSALSAFNSERAAGLDRPAFRSFWFTSLQGREVHSWLALPPGFDESREYPLVLFIHGGPFASSLDADHVRWSPHLLASPGYVVLLTDYTGSVGYGAQFSRNIEGDPLATPGQELIEAADAAIERFDFIDESRQAATGASYGGHLVNWLLGSTDRFDALVGHAGLVDLEGQYSTSDVIYHRELMNGGPAWGDSAVWEEQSPSSYVANFSTPTLLTIGEKDFRVPVNQTVAAWSYLQRMQVPSRLLVFHDANHWIMNGKEARYFWDEVHAWLDEHL